MIQNEQEDMIFDNIRISLKKLKKLLSSLQIELLHQNFKQSKYQGSYNALQCVPAKALPAVIESMVQQFFIKHACLQDIQTQFNLDKKIRRFDQFSHIQFTNLIKLNLSLQKFCSIEALGFIYAPKLRCLEFHDNGITNLDTLVKAEFPSLQIITFYHNPITKLEKICRFRSKKLTGYEFDSKENYSKRVEDYRFLFKMQNPIPKMIKIQDQKRINISEKPIFKILNQPGTNIMIFKQKSMMQLLIERLSVRD